MVTAGRILFAAIEKWFPEKMVAGSCHSWWPPLLSPLRACRKPIQFSAFLSFALAGLGLLGAAAADQSVSVRKN